MGEVLAADEGTQRLLNQVVETDNLQDLFDSLDSDGSGEVSIDEFCEGILKVASATPRLSSWWSARSSERPRRTGCASRPRSTSSWKRFWRSRRRSASGTASPT